MRLELLDKYIESITLNAEYNVYNYINHIFSYTDFKTIKYEGEFEFKILIEHDLKNTRIRYAYNREHKRMVHKNIELFFIMDKLTNIIKNEI